MNILMFSWEYPPLSHGGLARHVQDLSEALVKQGHKIYVITQGNGKMPENDMVNGVKVIRTTPVSISGNNFVDNILHLNFQMAEKTIEFIEQIGDIDLVHGHDWLVFWVSKLFKHSLKKPLLYTIHATEFGRNQGIYNNMQRYINDLEWYACFEAWKVIVCSRYMANEVKNLFQLPDDKVVTIANGVNEENYLLDSNQSFDLDNFKNTYASPNENIVFYVGRIVREKGIQVLLQAVPKILSVEPSTKFVIAGKGPHLDNLKAQADYLGIADRIYFTGFISDEERNKLYHIADVAVFPSIYEPFGIVALEAMVTKTPVVVSNVGGLMEFVEDGKNGLMVNPNDPHQLAGAILELIRNKEKSKRMAVRGYRMVKEEYTWEEIACKTAALYEDVIFDYLKSDWNIKHTKSNMNNNEESLFYRYTSQRKYS